jgi:hypothetical protein
MRTKVSSTVFVLVAIQSVAAAVESAPTRDFCFGERIPVPEGAEVTLKFDKPTYFLGENILLHFCVENTGSEPFKIDKGGDYRMASRSLRYIVTAMHNDDTEALDPDPSGFCMGGMRGDTEIKPGEKWTRSLQLVRYRRLEKPGTYLIRAHHDFGWKATPERDIPHGEARITLVAPDLAQAQEVVDRMMSLDCGQHGGYGEKSKPFADFTTLEHPGYLPILTPLLAEADERALTGVASIATPEATQVLINQFAHEDAAFATRAANHVCDRLPCPKLSGEGRLLSTWMVKRRYLAERAWRPTFAEPVLAFGCQQLASGNQEATRAGGNILHRLGTAENLPLVVRALDQGEDFSWLTSAVDAIIKRGGRASSEPESRGEQVVFIRALKVDSDFRPDGWESTMARILKQGDSALRELALRALSAPIPYEVQKTLPGFLDDPDEKVQALVRRHIGEVRDAALLP